ncbi:flavin reductase family protein [Brachybacterium halotolerans subsp. kimchii]|uniref:flavin reductase family protein n=1 Tax=Brachybacterium halotolerans TaxID=2795215 RepID=UPI001E3B5A5D|nr:flavin reductase family protein [Brachybacterium halotolerans]UEJ81216.1 flavin reductase family protein [Brachybacterium halotolerans subsp. kimchii]
MEPAPPSPGHPPTAHAEHDAAPLHERIDPAILYFGTPVVLVSTLNPDCSPNLAPISSAFWIGRTAVLGIAEDSRTRENLEFEGEAVLALPSAEQAGAVDALALTTGSPEIPERKHRRGYRHYADKFALAGLAPRPSIHVRAPGVVQCPVLMECRLERSRAAVCELEVIAVRVHESIRDPDRADHIDPDRWRPLLMSFQRLYGLGGQVRGSRLASIPEDLYR